MMRMMTMMLMMRHCEGAAAWRDAQGMWREFTWGGHGTGHSEQSGNIWIRKKSTPRCPWLFIYHLIHLNSHLEVYIIRHTHIIRGKKTPVNLSTNSNVSFCDTYGYSNLSFSSHRWVLGKWMSKNPNLKSNDDGDEEDDNFNYINADNNKTLRRGCCVKRLTRHMARIHFEGEGRGQVPFSWSFKNKESNPTLCFTK